MASLRVALLIVLPASLSMLAPGTSVDLLDRHRQLLREVREAVETQIGQGATEDQAVANVDLPQYRRFQGYSRAMEIAVRRVYRELTVGLG